MPSGSSRPQPKHGLTVGMLPLKNAPVRWMRHWLPNVHNRAAMPAPRFSFSPLPWQHDPAVEDKPSRMESLDGIPWHSAPLPFWIHRCKPQSRGVLKNEHLIDRCACGAMRRDGGRWAGRNETRIQRRRK